MVKPVLKWAGGKTQLLDELVSNFPDSFNSYHEPMIGSGALLFHLEPSSGSLNDMNPRISNFYQVLKNKPYELIECLEGYSEPNNKPEVSKEFSSIDRKGNDIDNFYYQQRALFNRRPNNERFFNT